MTCPRTLLGCGAKALLHGISTAETDPLFPFGKVIHPSQYSQEEKCTFKSTIFLVEFQIQKCLESPANVANGSSWSIEWI
jgi:hypothetical protein